MRQAVADSRVIDVRYLGKDRYIAACLLEGAEPALVDPGPSVSLPALEAGLAESGVGLEDLAAILLTHIHLDHAGAAGTILARNPRIEVYVHERGARHMIDPTRLLRSAGRLYGDAMDDLWGEFLPVPADRVRALQGGETIDTAGRRLEVAYTPGHASHHVSFFDTSNGTAFVGDTAGIRIDNAPYVLPVTPIPDIDLEAWETSLEKIEAWRADRLFVTHFGAADGVGDHLQEFRSRLAQWAAAVREGVESGADDAACIESFSAGVNAHLAANVAADHVPLYQQGVGPAMSWEGLARYWRKKRESET